MRVCFLFFFGGGRNRKAGKNACKTDFSFEYLVCLKKISTFAANIKRR